MSDRSIAGTVGGKGKISSRNLKKLTETAMAQYAAAVSLERNPATFGDAVIDISNNLNVQSANAFSAVKRAFPAAIVTDGLQVLSKLPMAKRALRINLDCPAQVCFWQ